MPTPTARFEIELIDADLSPATLAEMQVAISDAIKSFRPKEFYLTFANLLEQSDHASNQSKTPN